jgi:hypothetical protein
MIGREKRMLLRHYLEQGVSKSALARQLGISRDTIHRWVRARVIWTGTSMRDPWSTGRGPRYRRSWTPITDYRDPTGSVSGAVRGAASGGDPGRWVRGGYTQLKEFVRQVRPRRRRSLYPVRDAGGPPSAGGLRALSLSVGRAVRSARRARLLASAVVPVLPAAGHADADRRDSRMRSLFRRRAAGAAVRSDEGCDHARPAAGGRRPRPQRRVSALRESLGLHAARMSAVPCADERQGRASRSLPARQPGLRP